MKTKLTALLLALILAFSFLLTGCLPTSEDEGDDDGEVITTQVPENLYINGEKIPAYSGDPWYVVNGGTPFFTADEITDRGFYEFTELDSLGRCGAAWGSIGKETMPTDDRESISHIHPSGWEYNGKSNNNSYPKETGVNGTIYNRAHLLANQLVDKDVDKRNLITGTCSMNQLHMVKFENMVADYVNETEGHVMYRVTPYFEGKNLVCAGVLMEGYSVEDEGESVLFCVFIYNVQPGIYINYLTGENRLASDAGENEEPPVELPYDIITAPEADTPYLLLGNYESGERFFSGEISDGMQTTDDRTLAVEVYFEAQGDEGAYYIYYIIDGVKTYIVMNGNTPTSIKASEEKTSYWILDPLTGVFYTSREESHDSYGKRSLALDDSRTDIRAYYQGEVANGKYQPLLVVVYKEQ